MSLHLGGRAKHQFLCRHLLGSKRGHVASLLDVLIWCPLIYKASVVSCESLVDVGLRRDAMY